MAHRVDADGCYTQCIRAGLIAAYKGLPPAIAIEFARRVIPDEVRPRFDKTEEYCKHVGKAGAAAAQEEETAQAA